MFTMMVIDVMSNLDISTSEASIFQIFLTRIRAWQEFMRRGAETRLRPEAEIGLYGELLFLRELLINGVAPSVATESWIGPLNGTQDFVLGHGAVEVKTTLATAGFPAEIGSLEQLDNSTRQPLFLAAARIRLDDAGATLPTLVSDIRTLLSADPLACSSLNVKLLHAGYFDGAAQDYKRHFVPVSQRLFLIDDSFPKLTKAMVRPEISQARYNLDVDSVATQTVQFTSALDKLGII